MYIRPSEVAWIFVDRADIRMFEGRGGLRLLDEAPLGIGIGLEMVRKKLQCDKPVELGVSGFVNNAHATGAEFFQNLVLRNGLADHALLPLGSKKTDRRD